MNMSMCMHMHMHMCMHMCMHMHMSCTCTCTCTCACACTCDMCMHIYLGLMCRRALMLPSVARAQAVIKQAPRKSSLSESCGATIGSRAKPNTGTCSTHGSWVSAWAVHGQCMGRYW